MRVPATVDLVRYRIDRKGGGAKRLRERLDQALDGREGPRLLARIRRTLGGEQSDAFIDGYLTKLSEAADPDAARRIIGLLRDSTLDGDLARKAVDAAMGAAEKLSSDGDLDPATALLEGLLGRQLGGGKTDRRFVAAVVAHVRRLLAADRFDAAVELAGALFSKTPSLPGAVLLLEEAFYTTGRDSEANEHIRRAIEAAPDQQRYLLRHATRLYDSLDIESADRLLKEFIDRHPDEDSVIYLLVRKLIWRSRFIDVVDLLERVLASHANNQLLAYLIEAHIAMGDIAKAREALDSQCARHGLDPRDGWAEAQILDAEEKLDEAIGHLEALRGAPQADESSKRFAETQIALLRIRRETADILGTVPVAGDIRGVTVLVTQGSPAAPLWMGLVARELRKRGFATVVLEQSVFCPIPPTGDPDIDQLHGIIDMSGWRLRGEPMDQELRHDWTIDPPNEVAATEGFNFFQPVISRLGTVMRRYRVDFEHQLSKDFLDVQIKRADAMLAVCERISRTLGKRRIPVRFLGLMSHYLPGAVVREYCARYNSTLDVQQIEFQAAYQHYYKKVSDITTTSAISVANTTRNPALSTATRPVVEGFEKWLSALSTIERDRYVRDVESIMAIDRARTLPDPKADVVLRRIKEQRATGNPVVCLLGKLLYDVWQGEMSGPAHHEIIDWLSHTVESVRHTDTLLLIKPHPDEVRPQISRPTEFFCDFLSEELPENVIQLDHRWFNLKELMPLLDCGVLWSGTSSLELQAVGIPAIVCCDAGASDYPVPFFVPKDRAHYEAMIANPRDLLVTRDVMERSALLIKYMATPDVFTPYPYAHVPYLRAPNPVRLHWKMDAVSRYLAEGDPHITELADRCQ